MQHGGGKTRAVAVTFFFSFTSMRKQTLSMSSLDVVLERGVLHKGGPAHRAQVRPLSRVLPEVNPKRLWQREPLSAVCALKGLLARVGSRVLRDGPLRRVAPSAVGQGADKVLDVLVRAKVHHEVVADAELGRAVRAEKFKARLFITLLFHVISIHLPRKRSRF
jgi:hypothetical protein